MMKSLYFEDLPVITHTPFYFKIDVILLIYCSLYEKSRIDLQEVSWSSIVIPNTELNILERNFLLHNFKSFLFSFFSSCLANPT